MTTYKTIVLGALTLTVSPADGIQASLRPARGRHVFATAPFAFCRINDGRSGDSPCLWVGSGAFDLTAAEVQRVKKEFPALRVTGHLAHVEPGIRPITSVMRELPPLARRQAE